MKHATISKPLAFSPEQMAAALDAAPDSIQDLDSPYDPNDEAAVNAFWANAKVRMPGKRGKQRAAVKVPVSIRLSPDVLEYFKRGGDGWQTRLDDALQAYIANNQQAA